MNSPPPQPRVHNRRSRSGTALPLLIVALLVVAVFAGTLLTRTDPDQGPVLPWAQECEVITQDGTVRLTQEQAQLATTAIALQARGVESPDTGDLDPAVLERLAQGPPEDAGPSLNCRADPADDLPVQEPTASGLTPRAERLRTAMEDVFGDLSLGGFAPGGVSHGHMDGSAHYEGRAIDVFFRPVSEEARRDGWLLAHWLVAHAEDLDIHYVIFDDLYWNARGSTRGWRDYAAPDPGNEILRHLDHVHVDVWRGS